MWIMTTIGFYSAVQHRDNHDDLLIRARSKADLLALQALATGAGSACRRGPGRFGGVGPIETTLHGADYPHRMVISKSTWKALLEDLTDDVDYDNFKTAVARAGHPERANTYHKVWQDLLGIERERDAAVYQPAKAKKETERQKKWRYVEVSAGERFRSTVVRTSSTGEAARLAKLDAAEAWNVSPTTVSEFVQRIVSAEMARQLIAAIEAGTLDPDWWLAGALAS